MRLFLFLLICCIAISCSHQKSNSLTNLFPSPIKISHEVIVTPELSKSPYGLIAYDTVLVMHDPFLGKHFSLFDIKNNKELSRFGDIGKGSGEISMWCVGRLYRENLFLVHDPNQLKLWSYPIDSIVKNYSYLPTTLQRFPTTSIRRVCPVNDSVFIGIGMLNENKYAVLGNNGEVMHYEYKYPEDRMSTEPNTKYFAYQGELLANPTNSYKQVFVGRHGAVIDILNIDSNYSISRIQIPYILPEYEPFNTGDMNGVFFNSNSIIGCCDACVTADYIYILYTDDLEENQSGRSNERCSETILVFDWNGVPVKSFKADTKLYAIGVSKDNNTLFAIIKEPESVLVKFRIT